jgi:hypothetical protein
LHVDGRVTNRRGSVAFAHLLESVMPRGTSSSEPAAGRTVLTTYHDFSRQPGARRSLRDFVRAHCGFVDADTVSATVNVDSVESAIASDSTQQRQQPDVSGSGSDFETAIASAIDHVNGDGDNNGNDVRRSAFGDLFSRLAREFEDELERIVWG